MDPSVPTTIRVSKRRVYEKQRFCEPCRSPRKLPGFAFNVNSSSAAIRRPSLPRFFKRTPKSPQLRNSLHRTSRPRRTIPRRLSCIVQTPARSFKVQPPKSLWPKPFRRTIFFGRRIEGGHNRSRSSRIRRISLPFRKQAKRRFWKNERELFVAHSSPRPDATNRRRLVSNLVRRVP